MGLLVVGDREVLWWYGVFVEVFMYWLPREEEGRLGGALCKIGRTGAAVIERGDDRGPALCSSCLVWQSQLWSRIYRKGASAWLRVSFARKRRRES